MKEERFSGWELIGEDGARVKYATCVSVPVTPVPLPKSSEKEALRY
jgi:hypothetical protein